MEEMLGRKMKAVKRLVSAAEDADLSHEYNVSLEYDYFNSVKVNERDDDGNYVELGSEFILESNEHFNNLPVNTSLSNIQVPTNVYNKDPGILNGVYMSEALNPLFVDNFERDPTLTWQYFGSFTGFFRLYPGIKWQPDENGVIAFDCRNRNWYIQAATSPKDIVIVVDISGSMKGLRLSIAKHTITTILDTLGENDFVNIIAYNDYVHYVEPCFKGTLVQADLDNREVRVFTYLIGREVTFADNAKWIACNNKGYYTQISTLANVQENVMEYLHVLSRPMVINHDHDIIWTEAYMDSALFASQAQSLLLMTTVAMPVFSKKNETYKEGKKLKPKPNYNSVDLAEVEWEDTDEVLRTAMVNGETGAFSNDVRMPMEKGTRSQRVTSVYRAAFSDALLLWIWSPVDIMYNLCLCCGRIYCVTDIDPHHRKLSQLQAVIRYLTGEEPDLECDEELVQEVLFDAVVTAPLEAYWTALVLNSSTKFLTKADKDSIFTMDHFPLWYRRAAEHPPGSFIYYTPYEEGRGTSDHTQI
ncbi:UNVERIFIED_CONTAM: hypothetical protein FKN15_033137 [Acipenser sinensis]